MGEFYQKVHCFVVLLSKTFFMAPDDLKLWSREPCRQLQHPYSWRAVLLWRFLLLCARQWKENGSTKTQGSPWSPTWPLKPILFIGAHEASPVRVFSYQAPGEGPSVLELVRSTATSTHLHTVGPNPWDGVDTPRVGFPPSVNSVKKITHRLASIANPVNSSLRFSSQASLDYVQLTIKAN